ncbi:glycosyltransferase family 4 protein [Sphingomonas japonica]|uniref:Glycosyltransferase involved in cell wall biosynthesis n=1 Tax=Sphingomonas japonica TaxID=511662 RepID=A0ABX0U8R3_9SPHN|nr:glycosyltransferase family 4 protein [Sphingomonas japonica]NIJ25158.1 glycosyltransferase involved in cell wall biosynthesis [Sphingomonas japonica]
MTSSRPRLSVLVVAHAGHVTGGVNNFLRIMRSCYRDRVDASRFINGGRKGEMGALSAMRRMLRDYARFGMLLLRRRFDVLHVNPSLDRSSLPRELLFIWIARLLRPGIRALIFYRGWDWRALESIRASRWQSWLFVKTNFKADRILVLSTSFKDALRDLGVNPDRIHVSSTMFEAKLFTGVPEPARVDRQALLFLSRFIPAKGGIQTIEAFADLASEFAGWRLIMAGDGPERGALEARVAALGIGTRVSFTGYVSHGDKADLLMRSAIFVLPTAHPEGMPNAILEAMAAGHVIITTPVGGIPDIVSDDVNGVILPDPSRAAVAAAIRRYVADPALLAETSRNNREKAWTLWESSIVSGRMADHYEAIAGSQARNQAPPNSISAAK